MRAEAYNLEASNLISPYTSGTKLGFISRPIKSGDAFLSKYESSVRPLEKKPSKNYKNESLSLILAGKVLYKLLYLNLSEERLGEHFLF